MEHTILYILYLRTKQVAAGERMQGVKECKGHIVHVIPLR